ncbi:MAG: IS30 family transposase [Clostridia bacterium]|nr:IS30 family transposase [Clostridia bacterium]
MGHKFSHLTKADRYKIEALLKAKHTPREIAEIIHVARSTIYREISRAQTDFLTSELTIERRYNPDLAHKKYLDNLAAKGGMIKLAKDYAFAEFIEHKICDERLSPAAALASIDLEGKHFDTHVCRVTLYSWIDKGYFFRLTNKDLPVKSKRKQKHRPIRVQKRPTFGESIEKRPKEVENRSTFGHWEGDTVYSSKKGGKAVLFVYTERKTRKELIVKMPDRTAASGRVAITKLEERFGDKFKDIFKSITFDNGSEFSDVDSMKREAMNLWYCHPYSSWERGTNENQNRMIRRWYPKGTRFDDVSEDEIASLESWINNYPRKKLEWKTANMLFEKEMAAL